VPAVPSSVNSQNLTLLLQESLNERNARSTKLARYGTSDADGGVDRGCRAVDATSLIPRPDDSIYQRSLSFQQEGSCDEQICDRRSGAPGSPDRGSRSTALLPMRSCKIGPFGGAR
jgi:hypothetical protein